MRSFKTILIKCLAVKLLTARVDITVGYQLFGTPLLVYSCLGVLLQEKILESSGVNFTPIMSFPHSKILSIKYLSFMKYVQYALLLDTPIRIIFVKV